MTSAAGNSSFPACFPSPVLVPTRIGKGKAETETLV